MSEITDMTKKELFSSLNEHVDEINELVLEVEERYKLLWESYEDLDEDHRRLGYKNLELKEENEVLKQEESETQKAYDEGFEDGEQSMQEKVDKICEFWEKNSALSIYAILEKEVTLPEMLSNINESYNKIIDYETRMKKEIEVGDEVNCMINNHKMIVVGRKDNDVEKEVYTLIDEKGIFSYAKYEFRKTGKHYRIDEMLKELENETDE